MKYQWQVGTVHKRALATRALFVAGAFGVAVITVFFNFEHNKASATVPGNNTRVSLYASGAQLPSASGGAISRDGKFAVFANADNGVVSGDNNNATDVFVRDLVNNTVTRASVSTTGVSGNQPSFQPAISQTGRYVVFSSTASNLIDGRTITSSYAQMYMHDMAGGTTTLLSEVSAGTYANSNVSPTDVSADGRYVLFRSYATNLGPTITNGTHNNVFLLDTAASTVIWVNAQASGGTGYGNDTYGAQMSCDGSFIVFDSIGSYLGATGSSHIDVFLLDRRGGNTLTNITASGTGAALYPKISCNGNYIGFQSSSTNLDPLSTGGYHAFLYDRINSQFKVVDQNSSGSLANVPMVYLFSNQAFISLDDTGDVAFQSTATNLDTAATSGAAEVYLRNTAAGTTELLSRDSSGTAANSAGTGSTQPTISSAGKKAAYNSDANNLISGDTNSAADVFVSDTGL
jgi:hypothetical protein